ncbi:hypothetical protein BC828DRAFT_382357 [Blastocladiella britannica]|nr:hypothetical protein BC828DRAFT_382357 [Blastocladiella britannica]
MSAPATLIEGADTARVLASVRDPQWRPDPSIRSPHGYPPGISGDLSPGSVSNNVPIGDMDDSSLSSPMAALSHPFGTRHPLPSWYHGQLQQHHPHRDSDQPLLFPAPAYTASATVVGAHPRWTDPPRSREAGPGSLPQHDSSFSLMHPSAIVDRSRYAASSVSSSSRKRSRSPPRQWETNGDSRSRYRTYQHQHQQQPLSADQDLRSDSPPPPPRITLNGTSAESPAYSYPLESIAAAPSSAPPYPLQPYSRSPAYSRRVHVPMPQQYHQEEYDTRPSPYLQPSYYQLGWCPPPPPLPPHVPHSHPLEHADGSWFTHHHHAPLSSPPPPSTSQLPNESSGGMLWMPPPLPHDTGISYNHQVTYLAVDSAAVGKGRNASPPSAAALSLGSAVAAAASSLLPSASESSLTPHSRSLLSASESGQNTRRHFSFACKLALVREYVACMEDVTMSEFSRRRGIGVGQMSRWLAMRDELEHLVAGGDGTKCRRQATSRRLSGAGGGPRGGGASSGRGGRSNVSSRLSTQHSAAPTSRPPSA